MKRRTFLTLSVAGLGTSLAARKASALEFYPKTSDKKWAVVFATWCGTARDAGIWISEGMGGIADVFDVREQPRLATYDHLVIGSAIRNMKVHPRLVSFIEENQEQVRQKVRAFFVVCGNLGNPAGPEQKQLYIDKQLAPLCGSKTVPGQAWGGRITKALLSAEDHKILEDFHKSINKPYVNYDNLNRMQCLQFGNEILKSLKQGD